jgi:hypothetical protein
VFVFTQLTAVGSGCSLKVHAYEGTVQHEHLWLYVTAFLFVNINQAASCLLYIKIVHTTSSALCDFPQSFYATAKKRWTIKRFTIRVGPLHMHRLARWLLPLLEAPAVGFFWNLPEFGHRIRFYVLLGYRSLPLEATFRVGNSPKIHSERDPERSVVG